MSIWLNVIGIELKPDFILTDEKKRFQGKRRFWLYKEDEHKFDVTTEK